MPTSRNQAPSRISRDAAIKLHYQPVEYNHESNSFIPRTNTRWTRNEENPKFIVKDFWGHYYQEVYVTEDGIHYDLMTEFQQNKYKAIASETPPVEPAKLINLNKRTASTKHPLFSSDAAPKALETKAIVEETSVQTTFPAINPKTLIDSQLISDAIGANNRDYLKATADSIFQHFKEVYPPNIKSLAFDKAKTAEVVKNGLQALRIYTFLDTGKTLSDVNLLPVDPQIISDAIATKNRKSLKIIADVLYENLKKDYPSDMQSEDLISMSEEAVEALEAKVFKNALQALRIYFYLDTGIDLLDIDLQGGLNEAIVIDHCDKILKLLDDGYKKSDRVRNLVSGLDAPLSLDEAQIARFFKHKNIFSLIANVYENVPNLNLLKVRLDLGMNPNSLSWLKDRKIRQRVEASLASEEITTFKNHDNEALLMLKEMQKEYDSTTVVDDKASKVYKLLKDSYLDKLRSLLKEHHEHAGDLKREQVVMQASQFSEVTRIHAAAGATTETSSEPSVFHPEGWESHLGSIISAELVSKAAKTPKASELSFFRPEGWESHVGSIISTEKFSNNI